MCACFGVAFVQMSGMGCKGHQSSCGVIVYFTFDALEICMYALVSCTGVCCTQVCSSRVCW